MTPNHIFTVAITISALLYLGSLLCALWNGRGRGRVKRELTVLKAIIMAYMVVLAVEVLLGETTAAMIRLFRPSLFALFFLLFLSELVDAKRRG